jgi:hypothetical protein
MRLTHSAGPGVVFEIRISIITLNIEFEFVKYREL